MYTCIALHSVLAQVPKKKITVSAQGACTLAVLGSMQPEHKIPEITGTILKTYYNFI